MRTDLPYFAYGLLKPGELAHHQIFKFLASAPIPARVKGKLWIRDGLPLLELGGGDADQVKGFLLMFRKTDQQTAYDLIRRFEPKNHYGWKEAVKLGDPEVIANLLIGRKLEDGGALPLDASAWTLSDDPVFTHGLSVVASTIDQSAREPFGSAPAHLFDWTRFFTLQMAYLLLWSAIERYTSLVFGPSLDPMERVREFGASAWFADALRKHVSRKDSVSDARDPTDSYALDPTADNFVQAALYYYQIRNNLSHRGKSAWVDGERVRSSLIELQSIFSSVLHSSDGGVAA